MSVVLILHADEDDCFLTCGFCNLRLKIDQEYHCNNLSVLLRIEHCDESCERCKAVKDKCDLEHWFYTEMDTFVATVGGVM